MNFLKFLFLILANKAKEAADWASEHVRLSLMFLWVCVGAPVALLIIGTLIGAAGAVSVGQTLIIVGGLFAALMLTFFWLRAAVLTEVIVLASAGAKILSGDRIKLVSQEQATRFLQVLRGITAWVTFVFLYGMLVPLHRDLGTTAMVMTAAILMAAVIGAGWFKTGLGRYVVMAAASLTIIFGTLTLVSPRTAASIRGWIDDQVYDQVEVRERASQLEEVTDAGDKAAAEIDRELLDKLVKRRNELQRLAVQNNGKFKNDDERAEFDRLNRDIERLRSGTYWQNEAKSDQSTVVTTSRGKAALMNRLAPPPAVDLPDDPPKNAHLKRSKPSQVKRTADPFAGLDKYDLGKDDADGGVFRELKKYPDL